MEAGQALGALFALAQPAACSDSIGRSVVHILYSVHIYLDHYARRLIVCKNPVAHFRRHSLVE